MGDTKKGAGERREEGMCWGPGKGKPKRQWKKKYHEPAEQGTMFGEGLVSSRRRSRREKSGGDREGICRIHGESLESALLGGEGKKSACRLAWGGGAQSRRVYWGYWKGKQEGRAITSAIGKPCPGKVREKIEDLHRKLEQEGRGGGELSLGSPSEK